MGGSSSPPPPNPDIPPPPPPAEQPQGYQAQADARKRAGASVGQRAMDVTGPAGVTTGAATDQQTLGAGRAPAIKRSLLG